MPIYLTNFVLLNRIGLAVCRKLIDLMGGDIVLDEEYFSGIEGSPGARFSVFLNRPPLEMEPGVTGKDSTIDSAVRGPSESRDKKKDCEILPKFCKVLFVDDDTLLRRLFVRSLAKVKPDWTAQQASNGESALEMVANEQFDIIFMDRKWKSA